MYLCKKQCFNNYQKAEKTFSNIFFPDKIEAKRGAKLTLKELISRTNRVAMALINRGITNLYF
jgi:hypothetical protein